MGALWSTSLYEAVNRTWVPPVWAVSDRCPLRRRAVRGCHRSGPYQTGDLSVVVSFAGATGSGRIEPVPFSSCRSSSFRPWVLRPRVPYPFFALFIFHFALSRFRTHFPVPTNRPTVYTGARP